MSLDLFAVVFTRPWLARCARTIVDDRPLSARSARSPRAKGIHAAIALLVAVSELPCVPCDAAPRKDEPTSPPPCPSIEWMCDEPPPPSGDPLEQLCQCGPGEWMRLPRAPMMNPQFLDEVDGHSSEQFVVWRWWRCRSAEPTSAVVSLSRRGQSIFWHAGSQADTASANFSGGFRERWHGTLPACPRLCLLAAVGGGGVSVAVSCAARPGCSASAGGSCTGSASSRGNAKATMDSTAIYASAQYDSASNRITVSGNLGAPRVVSTASIEGTYSAEGSWHAQGTGSSVGVLTFSVKPDRTYCALTNLPVNAQWSGATAVALGISVDENGSASASATSSLSLSIQ